MHIMMTNPRNHCNPIELRYHLCRQPFTSLLFIYKLLNTLRIRLYTVQVALGDE